ncbi:PEP/pyruvate-binding domain-containing protein [Dactylosporangium sp. NPDC051541]|uniref:PEP/pyruvate-binding domain-containing protein n=1 Tax=Dactylosporangium sp. NPDC051541 TaxID=3363977 RepID=UPI0037B5E28D
MRVVPLADAGPECGNKAHALAVLIRAGLPVPDGFVVLGPIDAATLAPHLARLNSHDPDPHPPNDADPRSPNDLDSRSPNDLGQPAAEQPDRELTPDRAQRRAHDLGGHHARDRDGHHARDLDGRHAQDLERRPVAVRSSGLAEDSATASFAGQLNTVLGARGLEEVLAAIELCSTLTDRVRSYGNHPEAVPVIVQNLVRADTAGVLFTLDPRNGADAVVINAAPGLGEGVVSGSVVPAEIIVRRLNVNIDRADVDGDHVDNIAGQSTYLTKINVRRLVALGRRCVEIFGAPQDVEWAIEGDTLWVLQSRPITAVGAPDGGRPRSSPLGESGRRREPLAIGVPCSPGVARGVVRVIRSVDEFGRLQRGDVLVCRTTDPAWTPLFRVAAAVVTETGGVLSHAAIVAREYGIPAVAGVASALTVLPDGADVVVDGGAGAILAEDP